MKHIRNSRLSRIVACYLAIQLILTTIQPANLYALTGGPAQPEFNSFTPIGTSDMVDLSSGDFNYNLPIMDVGGYPLNLSYNSGITMDQEASWVGLGWNLNVGQISRQVRGIPDDFDGDTMTYENNIRDNITVGANLKAHPAAAGFDLGLNLIGLNLGIEYNNYNGFTFKPSAGISFNMASGNSIGFNFSTSTTEGPTISPYLSLGDVTKNKDDEITGREEKSNYGFSFNSRQGVQNVTINNEITRHTTNIGREYGKPNSGTSTFSFSNQTYTPTKRTPYINSNFAFNAALGTSIFFAEGQAEIYAYAGKQAMQKAARVSNERAYGYEHTEKATKNDILDFNRENDRVVGEHTATLAIPNYTYDVYSINGQGINGGFRPYRSQVGYVFDKFVKDISVSTDIPGIEVGAGGLFHTASDFKFQPSSSSTGLWEKRNNARGSYAEQTMGNSIDYEKVYFRNTGELSVDSEMNRLLYGHLGGDDPIRVPLDFENIFDVRSVPGKYLHGTGAYLKPGQGFNKVKRENRLIRNQAIQKLTKSELQLITSKYTNDNKISINSKAQNHHTNAIHVTKKDGSRYIYNQPVYNLTKVEASFNVGSKRNEPEPNADGTVSYKSGDNTIGNKNGKTHFYSKTITPAYAHAYLLTSVLSNDYQDLTGDGPTDDDLGSYTKFKYKKETTPRVYDWRVPIGKNKATYNEGLYSSDNDATANYTYGQKELKYVERIETKTHVAILKLSPRNDALGVRGENGGKDTSKRMMKLDEIALYSKPEAKKALLLDDNTANDLPIKPIKKATFIYDYSLCKGVPNQATPNGGKLTLKEVYFTYRGSNMGRYMPYKFTYEKDFDGDGKIDNNPEYNVTHYNIWGNYKKDEGTRGVSSNSAATNEEFPYVEQDRKDIFPNNTDVNKNREDLNVASWSLTKIDLPSGGDIDIDYESDDYKYVQNKRALQMFKVTGVGKTNNGTVDNTKLYGGGDSKYVYIKVRDKKLDKNKFINNYIGELRGQKIYFRFLVNMVENTNKKYDFVTGYMNLGNLQDINIIGNSNSDEEIDYHVAIPFERVRIEGGLPVGDDGKINPFSKAGWNFGRTYLNRLVHSMDGDSGDNKSLKGFIDDIVSQIGQISAIFRGPNRYLMDQRCANSFRPNKSFIRLQNPNGKKLGGGVRVAKIEMNDNWDEMTGNKDNIYYKMKYGQEYNYNNLDGTSSGVATYEPSLSKENPLVLPYEDVDIQRFLAPSTKNYVEGPLGASFFPSPQITYGRVEVKNLSRQRDETIGDETVQKIVSKHATGKVVSEFYTSKDFPTITKHTPMSHSYKTIGGLAEVFALNIVVKRHLAMSQGFSVELNDMNGKQKGQKVFAEGSGNYDKPISEVEYKYHVKDGKLDNEMLTYNAKGVASKHMMGVQYDVVNDFRTSINRMKSFGADINLGGSIIGIFPVVIPMISNVNFAMQNSDMRSTATVKVIHKNGILKEKIAKDNGASVFTKNLAYDKATGDVLLTQTTNEYGDSYYNLNYPAYWAYAGMGHSTKNSGILIEGVTYQSDGQHYPPKGLNPKDYLNPGDQLLVFASDGSNYSRVWVSHVYDSDFYLIDESGDDFSIGVDNMANIKVIRSGYKNMQSASMASVTSMKNPLTDNNGKYIDIREDMLVSDNWNTYKIVNTSGVEYQHKWSSQCEFRLPNIIYNEEKDRYVKTPPGLKVNTFLYNLEGNWKAKRSYAYLTGRHNGKVGEAPNPRNSGFLTKHKPFYTLKEGKWIPTLDEEKHKWTYASEVTKFSPYGAEVENKDALHRYSSAQYGYRYTLPMAVASNTKYSQLAFDGFEDYDYKPLSGNNSDKINPHFGFHDAGVSIDPIAHSGKNSLVLAPNSSAEIAFQIHCGDDDYALPKAVADKVDLDSCDEGQVAIKILSNDTFELTDKSKGLIEITVPPKFGTATINNNGTPNDITDDYILYKYTSDIFKGDTIEYKICNEIGKCSTAEVTINCKDVGTGDSIPVAVSDEYTIDCERQGLISRFKILENDKFNLGDDKSTAKIEIHVPPTKGTAKIITGTTLNDVTDDVIEYTRDSSVSDDSDDSFGYKITNSKGSSTALVVIHCKSNGDDSKPPKATDDSYTFGCSSGKSFEMDVLKNDYFPLKDKSKGKLEVGSGNTYGNTYNTGNGYVTVVGNTLEYVIDNNNNNPENDFFQYRITNEKGKSSIGNVSVECLTIGGE